MKQSSTAAHEAWAKKEQVTSEIIKRTLGGEGVQTLKMIGEIYMLAFDEGAHTVLRDVLAITAKHLGDKDGKTQNH